MKNNIRIDWLSWLNLGLMLWIAVRVEVIHSQLNALGELMNSIGEMLIVNLNAAADQFHAAILSIVNLFGGDAS